MALINTPAPDIPYFTPKHENTPGAPASATSSTPTLFTPLKIRGTTLRNRLVVAPMCQYSTAASGPEIGALTDWHVATLGHYAIKGAALTFIEATGVQPRGRISPNCPGLWDDAQIPGVKRVADFIRSQGGLSGIQLAHAGRKSSTNPPWVSARAGKRSTRADRDVGGWPDDVKGPSGGEQQIWDYGSKEPGYWEPQAFTTKEVQELVQDFAKAAERSVKAGVDVIEIHGAHGYGIHQFLSPISNRRTDEYGGSFENRTRLLFEIIKAIRAVIPESTPLFLRLSATDWMDESDLGKKLGSWTVEDTIEVAKKLPELGVDLLDVSSGGTHPTQKLDAFTASYQIPIAGRIREAVRANGGNLLVGAVGLITEASQAKNIVEQAGSVSQEDASIGEEAAVAKDLTDAKNGKQPTADLILVARQFMREPEWVLRIAHELGVDVAWPNQFLRVRFPKL